MVETFNSTSILIRESSGSVVECLTRDQGAAVRAAPASLCCGL